MSRRWLLSLLCLSLLFLSLVQLTRARGEFKVNETNTRILLEKEPAEVLLAVENSTGETLNARIEIELLDPRNRSLAKLDQLRAVGTGSKTLTLHLPFAFSNLNQNERRQLLAYRLHYRVSDDASPARTVADGVISLSEITLNIFDLRVATSELAREGRRYRARVQASHPITRRPASDVRIDGELTLEDGDNSVKIRASKTTDAKGYAILEFSLPPRFPQFPHTSQPAGGELQVIGRRGAIVATAKGEVLVDQFARILVTTDKPLYQPGQVMHLRALVFTPSQRALANQGILISIEDPEDTTIFSTVVKTSRFGVVNTDWSIPENTRLGDYRIQVRIDGGEDSGYGGVNVRISRYDLPNFTVSVQPDRTYYLPGQNAEVKVRADYLFGQPVTRGHVRVVRETEREWNYREQKWDIDEGETYEGETDANGFFTARINLAEDHEELSDEEYDHFEDHTYAAYFTDPTTNRTEQRRFDLRVTKDPIHVYVIENYQWSRNRSMPLKFYVSTFYADGSPARCKVNIAITDDPSKNAPKKSQTLRTNRYGLAKVSGLRLPREPEDDSEVELIISAVDSKGQKGSETEHLSIGSVPTVDVETDKSIYHVGEPIVASITSSEPNQTLFVDLLRDSGVILSERLKLHDGRGSITFTYKPEFKDRLSVVAYADFQDSLREVGTRTILYPRNPELNVNARTSQDTYRPGQDAQVDLTVRSPEGRSAESALGVVIIDKAVEERARTDREFGGDIYSLNDSLLRFLGLDEQVAGVSLRDLQRLDTSKIISPEMDLVAEVLLSRNSSYYPRFSGGDEYEQELTKIYHDATKEQLKPIKDALVIRYFNTQDYPKDESSLRRLLSDARIDLDTLRDPWGLPYRIEFFVDKQMDAMTFLTAGADKRPGTKDDFGVGRLEWPYFRSPGEAIDKAVRVYHQRTGGYIRDAATLRGELSREGFDLDQTRDRWGKPYSLEFAVDGTNFVIKVSTAGPDGKFTPGDYRTDDFTIWTSSIDYFAESRSNIDTTLNIDFKNTNTFPETEQQLRAKLRNSASTFESLRDPWNRPYYATFGSQTLYADRVRVENRTNLGEAVGMRTEVAPVTRRTRFVTLRSMGADGKEGTADDFSVAIFTAVVSEQLRGNPEPQAPPVKVVFTGNTGAIYGVVTDLQGAVISGANVTATRLPERQSFESKTEENGRYDFVNLPPGTYEVRFEAPGFSVHVFANVLVRASNVTEVNATLQPGTIAEAVTVTAATELLETSKSASVSQTVVSRRANLITKPGGSQQLSTPRLREYFPETLLWQPSIETDKQGRAQINFKLADNITTWKMVVIGSTEDGQIGSTEKEIKAFQPFFVEHDPPRVLTEGDEISLPVVVRNYLERPQKVDLEIKPEQWFSLLGPARKQTSVLAGDAARETFDLRAIASVKDGKQRITAIGSDENDAIEKPVTVHPDGEELSITAGDIVDDRSVMELNLPETMIPNSKRGELKIYPNLMAHVVESVEAIMQRPYGCGEQTISSTYPSLLLLRHYKQNGQDFPLRARAERYLNDGYSRLLNYREESGGFTYWGHGQPDVALTGYALRFLTAASGVISVDQDVITEAREWLLKQQRPDGSWPAPYWTATENSPRNALLTAYITRVLAATETAKISDTSKRALDYLSKKSGEIDEPYLLASYALAALHAKDRSRAKPVIDKLRTLAHAEGTTTYWSLETNTPFYGWGLAGRVETTALVVQALAKYCDSPDANCESDKKLINRALLFLIKQKDRYGVWYSTQATINVLDAMLTLFATNPAKTGNSATTEIVVNGRAVQTIQMPVADRLNNPIAIDISEFLNTGKNVVEIKRAAGLPVASAQAVANFYVPWANSRPVNNGDLRLSVKFDKTEGKINDEMVCSVDAERVAFRGYGMMLAEIGLPPGADVDRSSLQTAIKSSDWAIGQYDVLPDRVVVYLWPRAGGVKFNFKFRPRFGLNAKSASSVVYDYYNPDSRAVLPPASFRVK